MIASYSATKERLHPWSGASGDVHIKLENGKKKEKKTSVILVVGAKWTCLNCWETADLLGFTRITVSRV